MHEAGCTLEFQLHLHWLVLELPVGEEPGTGNIAQLQFGMWLVVFPSWGDHAVPLSIMTGWLTRLLVFCNGFRGWFCNRRTYHIYIFSWRGICCKYLQVRKPFLDIFVSPSPVCLNSLQLISPSLGCSNVSGIAKILFLVYWIGSNLPSLLFLFLELSWSCRACFCVYFVFSWIPCLFVSRRPRAVPFLFCLVYSDSLALESCCKGLGVGCLFSFNLSHVYWCGTRRSYMDA